MREILFRAKHIHVMPQNEHLNDIWVYGYLCNKNYINTVDEDEYGGKFESEILIDPKTVCQYTGLTDKNGRKIFEGDIVQDAEYSFEEYEPYIKGIVKFMTGTFDSGIYEYNGWVVEQKDGMIDHTPLLQYEKRDKHGDVGFEVIGNIFDNPELLADQSKESALCGRIIR